MKQPTKSELGLLKVIWNLKKATVREVNEEINKTNNKIIPTTLKSKQLMNQKGMLNVEISQIMHMFLVLKSKKKILY